MYQPTGLRKIFVQETETALPPQRLSKAVVAFFAVTQLCFGFNFGFIHAINGKYKRLIDFVTLITFTSMITLVCISFLVKGFGHYWMCIYILEYVSLFLMQRSSKYPMCEFLSDLLATNKQTKSSNSSKKAGFLAWTYFFLTAAVTLTSAIIYCSHTQCDSFHMTMINLVVYLPILGLNTVAIGNVILFYLLSAHMKDMKMKLKRKVLSLEQVQTKYKAVADNFAKFRASQDAIFIWWFITKFPEWMAVIWNHLYLMKSTQVWLLHGCSYAWALNITMHICLPAVFAEMTNVHIDEMKIILHDRLLFVTDEKKADELTRVLRYMEARPLLSKAWRLVPLDLELPVTMLSVCTTYLIVIIQFTHLYD